MLTPICAYHFQAVSLNIILAGYLHTAFTQPSSPSIYLSQGRLIVFHLYPFLLVPTSSSPLPESPVVSLHTQVLILYLQYYIIRFDLQLVLLLFERYLFGLAAYPDCFLLLFYLRVQY